LAGVIEPALHPAPRAFGGAILPGAPAGVREGFVGEVAENLPADAARSTAIFADIEDNGIGFAYFGELRGELPGAGVVAKGASGDVGDVAGEEFEVEGVE
jgi:hypothetical protein